jgi:hypothetical protein
VIRIEHVRARLKGLSAEIVLNSKFEVTWARGLLPNPAKVPYFQYRVLWYSIVQKFHADGETNTEISTMSLLTLLANDHDPVKVPIF